MHNIVVHFYRGSTKNRLIRLNPLIDPLISECERFKIFSKKFFYGNLPLRTPEWYIATEKVLKIA